MQSLIVTYDLRGRDETSADYADLIAAIKRYRWRKLMLSTWLVITSDSAETVCDRLATRIDGNDRLLVAPLGKPAAWRRLVVDSETMKARP